MASDFDDIFGDLKEDEQFNASLPSDFDEASIFGDAPSSTKAPDAVTKPTASDDVVADANASDAAPAPLSKPVAAHEVPVPVAPMPATMPAAASPPSAPGAAASAGVSSAPAKALWEQIGGAEQDDFLSWLDDGGAPAPSESQASDAMDDVSLDSPSPSISPPPPASVSTAEAPTLSQPFVESSQAPEAPAVETTAPPAPIPIHVAGNAAALTDSVQTVSLDDDDDDDFLEKIVESAKKKAAANGSRESSSSSLHIKSQSGALMRGPALGTLSIDLCRCLC